MYINLSISLPNAKVVTKIEVRKIVLVNADSTIHNFLKTLNVHINNNTNYYIYYIYTFV